MRKLLNRWRLTSLNISILRPFVKSIDVFASLISILSSVALVICACFICFILIPCSYNYYVWYYWNFDPVLFLFSHWIQWCSIFQKYLLYWLYSCLYQAFLKCMILCKNISCYCIEIITSMLIFSTILSKEATSLTGEQYVKRWYEYIRNQITFDHNQLKGLDLMQNKTFSDYNLLLVKWVLSDFLI